MVNEIDVKTLRTGLGLSQEELAEILGLSQAAISHWETKGVPKRGAARKLLQGFVLYGAPMLQRNAT